MMVMMMVEMIIVLNCSIVSYIGMDRKVDSVFLVEGGKSWCVSLVSKVDR